MTKDSFFLQHVVSKLPETGKGASLILANGTAEEPLVCYVFLRYRMEKKTLSLLRLPLLISILEILQK